MINASSGFPNPTTLNSDPSTSSTVDAKASTFSKPLSSKSGPSLKLIIGLLIVGLAIVGSAVAFYLMGQNQDVRQQAAGCDAGKGEVTCNDSCGWRCVAAPNTCASTCSGGGGGGGGACDTGWSCNGNCASRDTEATFNGTWQDGRGRWLWEAAGNTAACGGNPSTLRTSASTPPAGNLSNTCSPNSPTATTCRGQAVNSRCTGFAGSCVKNGTNTSTGYAECGCIPDTRLPEGSSCTDNSNCTSNNCLNNKCALTGACTPGTCINGRRCDYDPTNGLGFIGNTSCAACSSDSTCPSQQFCQSGACADKRTNGTACAGANQCQSGICNAGRCTATNATGGSECTGLANGANCTTTVLGSSGYCTNGACAAKLSNGLSCVQNYQCSTGICSKGICSAPAAETPVTPVCNNSCRRTIMTCAELARSNCEAASNYGCSWISTTGRCSGTLSLECSGTTPTACTKFGCVWTETDCTVTQPGSPVPPSPVPVSTCVSSTLPAGSSAGNCVVANKYPGQSCMIDSNDAGTCLRVGIATADGKTGPACACTPTATPTTPTPRLCIGTTSGTTAGNCINGLKREGDSCTIGNQTGICTESDISSVATSIYCSCIPTQTSTPGTPKTCYNQACQSTTVSANASCPASHPLSTLPSSCSNQMCPNSPTTPIAKYLKFTCPNGCVQTTEGGVTAWRCYENRQESTSPLTMNGACGQVDALSGSTDATYCGYTEYTCGEARCQTGGGNPPGATETPTVPPTNPPGPMCLAITMTNVTLAERTTPILGDAIRLTCGTVEGAARYVFQIVEPDNTKVSLQATGASSATYTISKTGKHSAQCQICTGNSDSTCYAFENIASQ